LVEEQPVVPGPNGVPAQPAQYKFGNVQAAALLTDAYGTGKESLKYGLGEGPCIIIDSATNSFKVAAISNNISSNAYKADFTVTRNIKKEFGGVERFKRFLKANRGIMASGMTGAGLGFLIGFLMSKGGVIPSNGNLEDEGNNGNPYDDWE